ncbi:MAG: hypothetical protein JRJ68_03275 [Deltaproteobacteria bacterium]|nr:hypothetical protein [Deltaproteobacteria bacterium]
MPLAPEFLPRIVKVDDSCGCTLTKASIEGLTPARFEALSGKEPELARVIASSAEAAALGVPQKGLAMLLKSSVRNMKPQMNKITFEEQSIILPYIQRRQKSIINAQYFSINAAVPEAGRSATAGDNTTFGVTFTVTVDTSAFATTALKNLERYFLPGMTLSVLTWDASKNAKTIQYQITGSANVDPTTATVTAFPLGKSDFPVDDDLTTELIPDYGMIQIMANNVSDWEDWCENQPTDNPMGLLVNWFQTSRESRCVNDVYRDTLQRILDGKVNAWDQTFEYQNIADQNKMASAMSEEAWLRSTFYNDYINSKQTVEGYADLPKITDPEDPSCTLEYKANALGIFTILNESGRVLDLGGNNLDLDVIFNELYLLKRNRSSMGESVSTIDCFTDRKTANNIFDAMSRYYQNRYGVATQRNAQVGQKVDFNGIVSFDFDLYDIPDSSVQWAVFREPFFDDFVDAFDNSKGGGDFQSRGRNLWFLDWSDVKVGIGGTESVTRKSPAPEVQELYKCRMKANIHEYNLRSTKWTTMVDRPERHLIIHNFNLSCPATTAVGCP